MSSEESYEESSEEWTSAERIIVHHHPKRATRMPLLEAIRKNGELHQSTALLFVRSSPILYTAVIPATAAHTEMRNSGSPSLPV